MAGANIRILSPDYNDELDLFLPVTPEKVREALEKEPDIDAVYLTSPNYEGLSANYEQIKEICHDKIVIVDEAHGAHFYFNS
jgi:arginine/lysine/ornithine decarboxylase